MAMNPDFTKLNLEEHPHCSYDEWKAELEKTTGKNYDALYENTMERIPVGPLYGKDVYDQCNHLDLHERYPSVPARTLLHDVCIPPVDGPPVRRVLHC